MATPKAKTSTIKKGKAVIPAGPRVSKSGRPYERTAEHERLVTMYAAWATQEEIATRLGISIDTLKKYYPDELRIAKLEADNFAFCQLMANIKEGKEASIIWYTKARMGWREGVIFEQRKIEVYREYRQAGELDQLSLRELASLYFETVGGVRSSIDG